MNCRVKKHVNSAPEFYDFEFDYSPEFIYMVFLIANSIEDEQYDEALIIGSYRDYLKRHGVEYFDIIVTLSEMNRRFCQFTLWSWDFDFEEEKYQHLEKIIVEKHNSVNQP